MAENYSTTSEWHLFGEDWVMPWDSRAQGFRETMGAYGRAGGRALAGTASGAVSGGASGAVSGAGVGAGIGFVGGGGVGALPGAGAGATIGASGGAIGGGLSGFLAAARSDSAKEATWRGARGGLVSGLSVGIAGPVLGTVAGPSAGAAEGAAPGVIFGANGGAISVAPAAATVQVVPAAVAIDTTGVCSAVAGYCYSQTGDYHDSGSGEREVLTRSDIMSQADEALEPLAERLPDAKVGYRGSLARGTKGAHKGGGPFDPANYDVDALVVSDDLAAAIPKDSNGFRNLGRLREYQKLIKSISDKLRSFSGHRDEAVKIRVYSSEEFARLAADEVHLLQ